MKPFLIAAAVLGACSSSEPMANDTPGAAAPTAATAAPSAAPPVSTAAAASMRPGELKTFRDWTVGCDNGLRCTMASLGPDMGDFPAMTVALTRAAGPDGGYEIALDALEDATPAPQAIVIDGRRYPVAGQGLTGVAAARVAAVLADARLMAIHGADKTIAVVSTAGASAALRYIDAAQGRVGTVTATVAKGVQQPASVPRAPALPVIAALAPGGTAITPTAAQLAEMRKTAHCEGMAVEKDDIFKPETRALGDGKTLLMVPCSAGAYNITSALFVLSDDRVAQAKLDAPTGMAPEGEGVPGVVNGEWHGDVLKTFARGRGLGDCGVKQDFVWDGSRLRLIEQSEMGECRGNPNYITTWRARVTRK